MNNLVFGILTILISSIGYVYAWRFKSKHNYTVALFMLILSGVVLRVYAITEFSLHPWDERYHALVAKNLMNHFLVPTLYDKPILPYDFKNWTINHVWLHKPPLPLWVIAGSFKVFGINEIALRLPSLMLTTVGIGLTYAIGKYFFNKDSAFIAAFLYSINGLILELSAGRSTADHFDTFYLFFISLTIFLIIQFASTRKSLFNLLAALTLGCAILTKWLPALIVLPVWLLLVPNTHTMSWPKTLMHFLIFCTVAAAVFIPWQIYTYSLFPNEAGWEAEYNFRHLTEVIEGQAGPLYYYLDKIQINYGAVSLLVLIWLMYLMFKDRSDKKLLVLSIWIFIPLLFFSLAKTKMQAYILFTAPALFIINGAFFSYLRRDRSGKVKWIKNTLLLLLIGLPVLYSIERLKPFEVRDRNPKWVKDLRTLKHNHADRSILFNYDNPVEAMFYSDIPTYEKIPSRQILVNLQMSGYTILVNENGRTLPEIENLKGIRKVNLSRP